MPLMHGPPPPKVPHPSFLLLACLLLCFQVQVVIALLTGPRQRKFQCASAVLNAPFPFRTPPPGALLPMNDLCLTICVYSFPLFSSHLLVPPCFVAPGATDDRIINRTQAREGSVCLSSADCPSGMDCDTFTHSHCWPKCDKSTGMDT
jgi:hypothetical protein